MGELVLLHYEVLKKENSSNTDNLDQMKSVFSVTTKRDAALLY